MRTHQPALNERRDTVYARQNLVGIFTGSLDRCSVMDVFVFGCAGIGWKPIGVNSRTGFNVILNKHLERFGFCAGPRCQGRCRVTRVDLILDWGRKVNGDERIGYSEERKTA